MSQFKGKVAVVTGGGRDIGRSISIKLAEEGAKVVVNYYNSEADANETVAQIISAGGEAIAVKACCKSGCLKPVRYQKSKG